MDSSNYNEYRNFISSLSEDNFNDLVLSYIKEYYNTKDAYISNGHMMEVMILLLRLMEKKSSVIYKLLCNLKNCLKK